MKFWRIALGFVLIMTFIIPFTDIQSVEATPPHQEDAPQRSYHVHVPDSYTDDTVMPLVVALHPFASSGKGMEIMTGLSDLADELGMMVAYPNAIEFGWDDGRQRRTIDGIETDDDMAFLLSMIDEISSDYSVDETAINVVGYANGGNMAIRLACEAPDTFSKIVTVATMVRDYQSDCDVQGASIDVLTVIGTEDVFAPPQGRDIPALAPIRSLSVAESLTFWADVLTCNVDSAINDGNVDMLTDCSNESTYTAYQLTGAGHQWLHNDDRYQLNQFGIDTNQVIGQFLTDQVIDFDVELSQDIYGNAPRDYRIFVPDSYDASQPTPIVIALHGRPDDGYGIAFLTDMNETAREEGFIVVYPDGLQNTWNYARGIEGYPDTGADDVEFLLTLIDDLSVDINIDRDRMYVMGFSNGGFMTQRVACEAGDTFAAFGVIGATFFPPLEPICDEATPRPMVFMHGTDDPSVPWAGTSQQGEVITSSVPDTMTYWAINHNCPPNGAVIEELDIVDVATRTNRFEFTDCEDNNNLILYAINGGGHTIPGVPGRLPEENFGATTEDLVAPNVIWEFFSQYTLAE